MNILEEANKIVNERSQERDRQYGSFDECMDICRDIYNSMSGKQLETKDMYLVLVALKLARERHSHKEDNLLDAVAYLGALNNYIINQNSIVKNTEK